MDHQIARRSAAIITFVQSAMIVLVYITTALIQCPCLSKTSTSGILVDDVLHLRTEGNEENFIQASVIFGCGQVQTGSFLDVAAPNGLFGLGLEKISVPSVLSREGFMADSFSMCFGHDGVGRISFGDKGSIDQEETPSNINPLQSYVVFVDWFITILTCLSAILMQASRNGNDMWLSYWVDTSGRNQKPHSITFNLGSSSTSIWTGLSSTKSSLSLIIFSVSILICCINGDT